MGWTPRDLGFDPRSAYIHFWGDGGEVVQPYAPAALYPQEDFWYSFLIEAESTPGP
jgi:hypothetical protein